MKLAFDSYQEVTKEEIRKAIQNSVYQTREVTNQLGNHFKDSVSKNNFYDASPIDKYDWTEGFYTGEIWLAYEFTGDKRFEEIALHHVDIFLDRIQKRYFVDHHDMGFLYSLSCVAAYKLKGSDIGKQAAVLAADNLISRFQTVGEFIQAWGNLGQEDNYRLIIDCLLNLPLLYWATEVTKDEKYANCAKKHIDTALKCIIREDNSTYHTYFFDKETGKPKYGVTHQGHRDGSAWARGQAWGIYGVALSYKYTRNPEYITLFKRITNFFIENLPSDLIPFWDFDFNDGSTEPKDSSASAIAICGMLEMIKYLELEDSDYYEAIAKKMLRSLINNCAVNDIEVSNGQLLHGTYAKTSNYNTSPNIGINECNTWGDYFYLEALMRSFNPDWKMYW